MNRRWDTVSVLGLGYIGLPTSVLFASHGLKVFGIDVNHRVLERLRSGVAHIVEPGLDEVLAKVVEVGSLAFFPTPQPSDAFVIAVPTPFSEQHKPDVSYVESAATSIAPVLKPGDLVVLESTSPVGTSQLVSQILAKLRPDLRLPHEYESAADVSVAYCPERVLPGKAMQELIDNDRVIGGVSASCALAARSLYRSFVKGNCLVTDSRTAEMCKLTENSFRDVNIAFANELSMICDVMGIDVWGLIELANRHPRVNILRPGTGVGGHCIAVDPWFIVSAQPDLARLIRTGREVNDSKPDWVLSRVNAVVDTFFRSGTGVNPTAVSIGCLGLAFKPDIDDLRESPAITVVNKIAEFHQGTLRVAEPFVDVLPKSVSDGVVLVRDAEQILNADIVVVLVAHAQFRTLIPRLLGRAHVVDACGLLAGARS